MRPIVNVYWLGRTSYAKALSIQNILFDSLKRKIISSNDHPGMIVGKDLPMTPCECRLKTVLAIKSILSSNAAPASDEIKQTKQPSHLDLQPAANSLLLLEHHPVYTIGLRAQMYNRDYVSDLRIRLAKEGLSADFIQTNRGGLITFHGPGQLIAYPIIYLGDFNKVILNRSIKNYVRKLEETIIDTLDLVGIKGGHTVSDYPGVWLANGARKIAFIGISCKRHVTMHGISINCDCDLAWFDHIVSCGIEDKQITSVYRELRWPSSEISGSSLRLNHAMCENGSLQVPWNKELKEKSRAYDVLNIANAFCSSFSHHFDCKTT